MTLDALNAALADDFTSAPALRELLRRGAPPVPPGAPITSCPIYVLLESYELMLEMVRQLQGASWRSVRDAAWRPCSPYHARCRR